MTYGSGNDTDKPPDRRHAFGRPDNDRPATDLYETTGIAAAWSRTYGNPYFYANLVYIIYTSLILSVNSNSDWTTEKINNAFLLAACVHLINAVMYIWVWVDAGYKLTNAIIIPDYLNVTEALFYLASAVMYRYQEVDEYGYDPMLHKVHVVELVASTTQLFAAFGWVTVWYFTHQRVPGRGFTLDDPDMWANVTIVTASIIYVVYNMQLLIDPDQYYTNFSYMTADKIYMVNAVSYTLAGLRDLGWFWFLPTAGRFPSHSNEVPLLEEKER